MKTLAEWLPAQLKADLAGIRSSVRKFNDERLPGNSAGRIGAGEEGDRILAPLERWLLDEEQKQMLRLNPRDIFFLYASAYLCHISRDGAAATYRRPFTTTWGGSGRSGRRPKSTPARHLPDPGPLAGPGHPGCRCGRDYRGHLPAGRRQPCRRFFSPGRSGVPWG